MNRFEKISQRITAELDLKPFINFLVILIPVLMLSAEFSKISIINLKAPDRTNGISLSQRDSVAPLADHSADLGLTLMVSDSAMTLGSRRGLLPSIYYKEYHTYVSKQKRSTSVTVTYDARNPRACVINPDNGRPFGRDERQSIALYVADGSRGIVHCLYDKEGALVTDLKGNPLSWVALGEQVYALGSVRKAARVTDVSVYALRPLSVYDEMRNRLVQLRERSNEAPDRTSICIVAERSVVYDKIVQLMDVARSADFPDISIGRL